jgi:hypothetical protein
LKELRLGVEMTRRQAEVFDLVKREPGQSCKDLAVRLGMAAETVRVTVWQVNEVLEDVGWCMRGVSKFGYALERIKGASDGRRAAGGREQAGGGRVAQGGGG